LDSSLRGRTIAKARWKIADFKDRVSAIRCPKSPTKRHDWIMPRTLEHNQLVLYNLTKSTMESHNESLGEGDRPMTWEDAEGQVKFLLDFDAEAAWEMFSFGFCRYCDKIKELDKATLKKLAVEYDEGLTRQRLVIACEKCDCIYAMNDSGVIFGLKSLTKWAEQYRKHHAKLSGHNHMRLKTVGELSKAQRKVFDDDEALWARIREEDRRYWEKKEKRERKSGVKPSKSDISPEGLFG